MRRRHCATATALLATVTACWGAASIDPPVVTSDPTPTPTMALPPLGEASDAAVQEAARLIAASRAAYASCATYEDEGTSDHWIRPFVRPQSARPWRTPFHTAFAGRNALRFAYGDINLGTAQLLSDRTGVWWIARGLDGPEREESLDLALGALGGVSSGLSAAILPLLLGLPPDALRTTGFTGRFALDLPVARTTAHADIDGTLCDAVEGAWSSRFYYVHRQVWIARSDFLIRRIVEDRGQTDAQTEAMRAAHTTDMGAAMRDQGRSETEVARFESTFEGTKHSTFRITTYRPRCNQPIAPTALVRNDEAL